MLSFSSLLVVAVMATVTLAFAPPSNVHQRTSAAANTALYAADERTYIMVSQPVSQSVSQSVSAPFISLMYDTRVLN